LSRGITQAMTTATHRDGRSHSRAVMSHINNIKK
jgi:hypothetical protein